MLLAQPSDNFADERGVIRDILTADIDSVTRITTVKDAVRGNHRHHETVQWTYVLAGSLLVADGTTTVVLGPGEIVRHDLGVPHAWMALTDTDVLVFTRGPRRGADFEDDTERLTEPLLP